MGSATLCGRESRAGPKCNTSTEIHWKTRAKNCNTTCSISRTLRSGWTSGSSSRPSRSCCWGGGRNDGWEQRRGQAWRQNRTDRRSAYWGAKNGRSGTKYLFWLAGGLIVYTYLGYACWLRVRMLWRSRPVQRGSSTPLVSIAMVVRFEEQVLETKLQNLMGLDYPTDRCQNILVSANR